MNLELTDDHRELRAIARQALDGQAPLSLARSFLDGARAEPLHPMLDELGWHAVGLDDDGFGLPGLILLAEACGAHAAPQALVDTGVAARLAQPLADPGDPLVGSIAAGATPTAVAVIEPAADWTLVGLSTTARRDGDGWIVEGEKAGVQHAASVDAFAVIADAHGEPAVVFVAADAAGVGVQPVEGLDAASAPGIVTLDVAVDDAAVLTGADAAELLERAFAVGAVATAAEGLGAASAALDLAIEYAGERQQFGRPIGSFQALKHLMADAHVDREAAWSSVLYAAAALDEGLPEAPEAAAVAKAFGARASRSVVEAALQVLGGIAFTWEHDVHLLQRRVLSCERRFGDALQHEAALGAALAARGVEVPA